MVDKVYEDILEAAKRLTGLERRAIDYGQCQMRIAERAKDPNSGYTEDEWDELDDYVVVDKFKRVGNFMEEMTYPVMKSFLKKWAKNSTWEGSFKRVHEHDNVVYLELEERNMHDGELAVANSVSVYHFNDEGKLYHLDVYLQRAPSKHEGMPNPAYEEILGQ